MCQQDQQCPHSSPPSTQIYHNSEVKFARQPDSPNRSDYTVDALQIPGDSSFKNQHGGCY